MAMKFPKMERNSLLKFYFYVSSVLFLCFLLRLSNSQGLRSRKLSIVELQAIFGAQNAFPEYSIFRPRIVREISGNSRSKRAVSEPTVFEFNALGQNYRFNLKPVEDLISENFVLISRYGNRSDVLNFADHSNCAFQGVEERDESKLIALVMCGNLRGVVKMPDGELVIEPLPEVISRRRRYRRDIPQHRLSEHIVYRRKEQRACSVRKDEIGKGLGLEGGPAREYLFSRFPQTVFNYRGSDPRSKVLLPRVAADLYSKDVTNIENSYELRSPGTYYIETAVFVDRDLLRLMQINFPSNTEEQVIEVVLAMVNAVQLLYNDATLGHKIKYVLKRLEILKHDPPDLSRPHDIDAFLTKFCLWQNSENPSSDNHALHWDHALILTGLDLYTIMEDGKLNSQVVGLAPVAGMCTSTSSCTVNEGRHFESVYVVAHEIGHNLGMRHDGPESRNNCDPSNYLMSPTLGSGKVKWSSCSKRYLSNFLSLPQSECLRDRPSAPPPKMNHESPILPGQRFSSDQQCLLKNGVGSRASYQQPPHELCEDLHCIKDGYTWTSHPALEGTTCGNFRWCRRGKCEPVPADLRQHIKNHISSPHQSLSPSSSSSSFSSSFSSHSDSLGKDKDMWESWSDCKSSCLYGLDGILSSGSTGLSFKKKQCRSCRNDYRYKVCSAVRQCSMKKKKTLQDYAEEMCRRLMREDVSLSGYAARLPVSGIRRCEVECLRNSGAATLTRAFYPDGTICQSSTNYPTYCVGGFCTEFRCESNTLYTAHPADCRSNVALPQRPIPNANRQPTERIPSFRPFQDFPLALDDNNRNSNIPNSSSANAVWGPWLTSSDCRFSCITPSKGIQLVSRSCLHLRGCDGLNRNIQLCTPETTTCEIIQTPFKYASEVCQRYSKRVKQLSGIGMQLSSTSDDPNRSCTVACQDAELKYRFYRVNGRDGWFPFGTECSKDGLSSYCLNGKCLEFNLDGTPLRDTKESLITGRGIHSKSYRSISFHEDDFGGKPGLSPLKRIDDHLTEAHWRIKRNLKPTSHRLPGLFEDSFLLSLVDEINATFSSGQNTKEKETSYIDLQNPLFNNDYIAPKPNSNYSDDQSRNMDTDLQNSDSTISVTTKTNKWRITNSPCSVTCGEGTMKQLLKCINESGEDINPYECSQSAPQLQNIPCSRDPCGSKAQTDSHQPISQFGKWLIGVVENAKASHPYSHL